jgi:hypothetical protein
MPWLPELFSGPALEQIFDRAAADARAAAPVPYFAGVTSGETDALVRSFAGGPELQPAGGQYVHRGRDELVALYELFFSNGGGIQLEHCAVTDDGRSCAHRSE